MAWEVFEKVVTICDFVMIICAFVFSTRLWHFTRTLHYTIDEMRKMKESIVGATDAIEEDGIELRDVLDKRLRSGTLNQRDAATRTEIDRIIKEIGEEKKKS